MSILLKVWSGMSILLMVLIHGRDARATTRATARPLAPAAARLLLIRVNPRLKRCLKKVFASDKRGLTQISPRKKDGALPFLPMTAH